MFFAEIYEIDHRFGGKQQILIQKLSLPLSPFQMSDFLALFECLLCFKHNIVLLLDSFVLTFRCFPPKLPIPLLNYIQILLNELMSDDLDITD